jgi:hypothetical protein
VDSPTSAKRQEDKDTKAAGDKKSKTSDVKGKSNDLTKDFKKFSLQEVPNGLTGADYGSLRA